jgi:hypothetical protein
VKDLDDRSGRGFQESNLFQTRAFYLTYPHVGSADSLETFSPGIFQTASGKFPLPWSHHMKLLSVKSAEARTFYETEALHVQRCAGQFLLSICRLALRHTPMSKLPKKYLEKFSERLHSDSLD